MIHSYSTAQKPRWAPIEAWKTLVINYVLPTCWWKRSSSMTSTSSSYSSCSMAALNVVDLLATSYTHTHTHTHKCSVFKHCGGFRVTRRTRETLIRQWQGHYFVHGSLIEGNCCWLPCVGMNQRLGPHLSLRVGQHHADVLSPGPRPLALPHQVCRGVCTHTCIRRPQLDTAQQNHTA